MVFTSLSQPRSAIGDEEKYPALRGVLLIWKVLVIIQVLVVVGGTIYAWATVKIQTRQPRACCLSSVAF